MINNGNFVEVAIAECAVFDPIYATELYEIYEAAILRGDAVEAVSTAHEVEMYREDILSGGT